MTTITFDELTALAASDSSIRDLITHSDSTERLTAVLAERGLDWVDAQMTRPDYASDLAAGDPAHARSGVTRAHTTRTCGAAHPCKQTC